MKFLMLLLVLMLNQQLKGQIVDIPDQGFKSFLIAEGIDDNGDGEIQITEAEAISILKVNGNDINSIKGIKSFTNLTELSLEITEVTEIDISGLENLIKFSDGFSLTSTFMAVNCTSLEVLNLQASNYDLVDLTGCTSLTEFQNNAHINKINFTNCTSLQKIDFIFIGLDDFDITGCTGLTYFKVDNLLSDFDFDFSEVPLLDTFIMIGGQTVDINIENSVNLNFLNISFIDSLFVKDCPELESIVIDHVDRVINLSDLPKLQNLSFWSGYLNTFRVNNCSILNNLGSAEFNTSNFILTNCISFTELDLENFIEMDTCDLTGMSSLREISLGLGARYIKLDGCIGLESFTVQDINPILEYDFSDCISLNEVNLGDCYQLHTLILQNGSTEMISMINPFALSIVCVDPNEFVSMQSYLSTFENIDPDVTINCSFATGGNPFALSGTSYLDINNDSCKTSNVTLPYSKYEVSNEILGDWNFFSDDEGHYSYNLPEGQYTFGPELLFGDYFFTAYPENKTVNFPLDGTAINQDFCFIPNPVEVDVIEVHLIPLEVARPGFDTRYLITYTNTGNVTRGGDIKLTFQDEFMDLVTSEPPTDIQDEGFLSWSFEDLIPYETRIIEFTMNLNSPMDDPALNGDDILNFKAEVGPLGNQTLTVYWSHLNQEVVNSFDPNDKTCLNGNAFDQELVGDYLKYMIRFENTGTAEAVNIVVTDTLDDTKFDVRTLQVINASHDVETELVDNVVKFIFKDIYLPFEDATNDGYVTFKIKTLPSLVLGDDIQNKAEIFFDFNFPIITNTTSTIISDLTTINALEQRSFETKVTPNPATETIRINSQVLIDRIEFYDISGRLLNGISYIGNRYHIELNIDQLNSGVYLIKAFSKKGVSKTIFVKH